MLHADHTAETARRALVLDPDLPALALVQRALAQRQVAAVVAGDGDAGLARLLDELLSLDVLVMALDLPGRDARALARLIRKAGNERDLALVVIADAPTPALRLELRGLGVDAIVDRADGPEAIASAALGAIHRRGEVEEIELEAGRHAPAAEPLGETRWFALDRGDLAMVA
ncbi:MAG: response regulator [Anaeromyxobacteraceae bacterium]